MVLADLGKLWDCGVAVANLHCQSLEIRGCYQPYIHDVGPRLNMSNDITPKPCSKPECFSVMTTPLGDDVLSSSSSSNIIAMKPEETRLRTGHTDWRGWGVLGLPRRRAMLSGPRFWGRLSLTLTTDTNGFVPDDHNFCAAHCRGGSMTKRRVRWCGQSLMACLEADCDGALVRPT